MSKELFIHIDYTIKESTKISVSNYFNSVSFVHTVDLNSKSLFDALQETFSLYKAHYIQLSLESQALKLKLS